MTSLFDFLESPKPRKCGRPRTYTLDEHALDALTPDSCYVLGFLMADGYIVRKSDRAVEGIGFALAAEDYEQLDAIRRFFKSNAPIRNLILKDTRPGWENIQPQKTLYLYSRALAERAMQHGIKPAKSPDAKATSEIVASPYFKDFVRGVMDGDGSLYWGRHRPNHGGFPAMSLCGAKPLMEQFAAFVRQHVPGCVAKVWPAMNIWSVKVQGTFAQRLAFVLYDGCAMALPRKLAKARELIAAHIRPQYGRKRAWQ